ncbi:MAG: hypothetical protein M1826_000630 [Phylliscum demangeonii]|nr:MAG: hypothetical protein M1826_000630 [Phylliscum demangeonii]
MAGDRQHPVGSQLLNIYIALFVVATVVVMLRLFARATHRQALGWDDAMIGFAWSEYIFEMLFLPAVLAVRTSILLLYRRINPNRRFRLIVDIMIGLSVIAFIATIAPLIFQCHPIRRFWLATFTGTCGNVEKRLVVTSAAWLVLDLLTLALPVPMVLRLHVSTKQKIGLCVMFTLGICSCVMAAVRLPSLLSFRTSDPLCPWSHIKSIFSRLLTISQGTA